jgi:hypothetical protein
MQNDPEQIRAILDSTPPPPRVEDDDLKQFLAEPRRKS